MRTQYIDTIYACFGFDSSCYLTVLVVIHYSNNNKKKYYFLFVYVSVYGSVFMRESIYHVRPIQISNINLLESCKKS